MSEHYDDPGLQAHIEQSRRVYHEATLAENKKRELRRALAEAKRLLNVEGEMKVTHGSVYTQAPTPKLHENIFLVLIAWAADMAYEISEQAIYAWRQRPWKH